MARPGGLRLWQSYLVVSNYILYTRTRFYEVLWIVWHGFFCGFHLGFRSGFEISFALLEFMSPGKDVLCALRSCLKPVQKHVFDSKNTGLHSVTLSNIIPWLII